MRYRNESEFNRDLSRRLESLGAVVMSVVGSEMQGSGWPDRYVAHVKFHGWFEGKKDDRQLTALQREKIRELCLRGVPALETKYASDVDAVRLKGPDGRTWHEIPWAKFWEQPLDWLASAGAMAVAQERAALEERRARRAASFAETGEVRTP
jgi:hypothetical protein